MYDHIEKYECFISKKGFLYPDKIYKYLNLSFISEEIGGIKS